MIEKNERKNERKKERKWAKANKENSKRYQTYPIYKTRNEQIVGKRRRTSGAEGSVAPFNFARSSNLLGDVLETDARANCKDRSFVLCILGHFNCNLGGF